MPKSFLETFPYLQNIIYYFNKTTTFIFKSLHNNEI